MQKRGQISIEYLIVVGFITTIVIGLLSLSYFYASGVRDQIKVSQIKTFAEKIIAEAERVYYAGEPSKTTITAYLPPGISSLYVAEQNLIISVRLSSGIATTGYTSNVPINVSIDPSEGVKEITITAQSDRVLVSQS